jgi:L-lactate utilization protein LutB
MEDPIKNYWQIRLGKLKTALENNDFEVFLADNVDEAKKIVLEDIIPNSGAKSFAFGGSMTVTGSGLYEAVKKSRTVEVLDTYDRSVGREEYVERRRKALLTDLFLTGTNAVTESGQLINLDRLGNRVAAITFGPKNVVILLGRNKLVVDLDEAMGRVMNYVAPANAMRLDMKTPCAKTSYCEDCNSPDRICNTWTITEKSYPKGRIKIVLINEDWGL